MTGWVCSYRKIWDNPIFKGRGDRVAVWHWLLHKAAWKDTHQDFHGKKILVKRGQVYTSYSHIEGETGVGRQVIRTLFDSLSAQHGTQPAINIETNTGRMLITLCNYDKYQERQHTPNTGANHELTSSQHAKEQDKQINNPSIEGNAAAPPSSMVEVSVDSAAVWNAGKPFLASRGVSNPGAMIGRWLKSHKPSAVLEAMAQAQRSGTQDPVPYITQILENGENHGNRGNNPERLQRIITAAARGTSKKDWG